MTPHWYLVKRNWPHTKAKNPVPAYAGLGGEVWPFDSSFNFIENTKEELRGLHERMERSETFLNLSQFRKFHCTDVIFAEQPFCTDLSIAEEYFAAVKKHCGNAWLLQITPPQISLSSISGLDIGNPSGGYSIIESELIVEGLVGPKLNEWGLIQTLPDAFDYLESRKNNERLEQLDYMMVVSINVIKHS